MKKHHQGAEQRVGDISACPLLRQPWPKVPSSCRSRPSHGAVPAMGQLSPPGLHFRNSFRERRAGPRGAVSLHPCPWEAERGDGEERRWGLGGTSGCRKQSAERGREMTFSPFVCSLFPSGLRRDGLRAWAVWLWPGNPTGMSPRTWGGDTRAGLDPWVLPGSLRGPVL